MFIEGVTMNEYIDEFEDWDYYDKLKKDKDYEILIKALKKQFLNEE